MGRSTSEDCEKIRAALQNSSVSSKLGLDPVTQFPLEILFATAYHEAGHAVMSLLLDEVVSRAVVDPTQPEEEDSESAPLGYVRHECNELSDRRAMIAVAGFVAEFMYTQSPNRTGATSDFRTAAECFGDLDASKSERLYHLKWLASKCQRFLLEAWPCVVLVAEALLLNRDLDGRDVVEAYAEGKTFVDEVRQIRGLESTGELSSVDELENRFAWTHFARSPVNRREFFRWTSRSLASPPFPGYGDAAAQIHSL